MKKTLIIMMGIVWASLALGQGMTAQDCKKTCSDIQKTCEDSCKENIEKSKRAHCAPACKQVIEMCKKECDKQKF